MPRGAEKRWRHTLLRWRALLASVAVCAIAGSLTSLILAESRRHSPERAQPAPRARGRGDGRQGHAGRAQPAVLVVSGRRQSHFPPLVDPAGVLVRRTSLVAPPSACEAGASPLSYAWPVRPFNKQHPVRGNFGDPRTIFFNLRDILDPEGIQDVSFHNGVDISAPPGTPVYPVVSGRAHVTPRYTSSPFEVVVDAAGRRFQYWHIHRYVREGEYVRAQETVLGYVLREARHVHLSEIRGLVVQNPLAPGHLTPYRDSTPPVVAELVVRDVHGRAVSLLQLRGRVRLSALAYEIPAPPVPGNWYGFPVAPALVSWRMTDAAGRQVVRERVVVDFRRTLPPRSDFWRVYAPGTYQNFPVLGDRFHLETPGRYLFNLTPRPLDTSRLPTGRYLIRVDAADVCGNRGSLTEQVSIAEQLNQPGKLQTRPPSASARLLPQALR